MAIMLVGPLCSILELKKNNNSISILYFILINHYPCPILAGRNYKGFPGLLLKCTHISNTANVVLLNEISKNIYCQVFRPL